MQQSGATDLELCRLGINQIPEPLLQLYNLKVSHPVLRSYSSRHVQGILCAGRSTGILCWESTFLCNLEKSRYDDGGGRVVVKMSCRPKRQVQRCRSRSLQNSMCLIFRTSGARSGNLRECGGIACALARCGSTPWSATQQQKSRGLPSRNCPQPWRVAQQGGRWIQSTAAPPQTYMTVTPWQSCGRKDHHVERH